MDLDGDSIAHVPMEGLCALCGSLFLEGQVIRDAWQVPGFVDVAVLSGCCCCPERGRVRDDGEEEEKKERNICI